MPEKIAEPKLPRGLTRLAFRAPLWLYRIGLGGLLGHRFLRLTHTGRKTGLLRQSVLEIVRYDKVTGTCIVASGWGNKSDWYQNVSVNPLVDVQVGTRRFPAIAERLSQEEGGRELLDYAHRHPQAFRELARFMGYRLDGTENDIQSLGQIVPMFSFKSIRTTQM
jgi:deazaflavin-dependent oxidoreductase (nitroreductase family)